MFLEPDPATLEQFPLPHLGGTSMSAFNSPRDAVVAARARVRRRWLTVLAAMAAATASWSVAVPLLGVDLVVRQGSGSLQVSALAVVLASLAAGLGGWLLLALLERWTRQGRIAWRVIAALVLLVSLLGPLSAVDATATAVLIGLHCLVGAILILGLPAAAVAPHDQLRPVLRRGPSEPEPAGSTVDPAPGSPRH
jgi:hypothetical protein